MHMWLEVAAVRFIHERRQRVVDAHNLIRASGSLDPGREIKPTPILSFEHYQLTKLGWFI
jgi:hypothetical protein